MWRVALLVCTTWAGCAVREPVVSQLDDGMLHYDRLRGVFHWVGDDSLELGVASDVPERVGDTMLDFAASLDPELAKIVEGRGRPDGFFLATDNRTVWLLYLRDGVVVERLRDAAPGMSRELPIYPGDVRSLRIERLLADLERADEWDFERATYVKARAYTVARRVMLGVFAEEPQRPRVGTWTGILVREADASTARHFGHAPDLKGQVVSWVDPEGAAAGLLAPGDLVLERVRCPEELLPEPQPQVRCLLVEFVRAAKRFGIRLQYEAIPVDLRLVVVRVAEENAVAMRIPAGALEGIDHDQLALGISAALVVLAESDDLLAWVFGHEIAHFTLGHLESRGVTWNDFTGFLSNVVLDPGKAMAQVGDEFRLGWTAKKEREADRIGTFYALAAGYDPIAVASEIEQFLVRTAEDDPHHPPVAERMQTIRSATEEWRLRQAGAPAP